MNNNKSSNELLKGRHLRMIALGGVIGTGLFFGTAKSIHATGPSIILAYILGGLVIYIILRALGEMTVDSQSSGSFSEYANRYVSGYAGFISGWSAWFQYTVVCMVELTAVTIFFKSLMPEVHIAPWLICLIVLAIFTAINLLSVRVFGEFEFWFAGIKVIAIIMMLIFSAYLLIFKNGLHTNLAEYAKLNIFFAGGAGGFVISLVAVVFSFGGSEFVSIAAGESENPKQNVPKAINGVIIRIILFYVLTMVAIILLYPYQKLSTNISPFVDVFRQMGLSTAAIAMNLVAITAALSAFNSCLYGASRMLFNLSHNGYAPKTLSTNKYGKSTYTPKKAILASSIAVAFTVLINYLFPEKAFIYLLTIATSAILIVWFIILITQIYFRRLKNSKNESIDYKLGLFPYTNIFAIIGLIIVIVGMSAIEDMRLSLYITPLWILLLSIFYIPIRAKIKRSH